MYSVLSVLFGAVLCLLIYGFSFLPSGSLAETDEAENVLDPTKANRRDRDASVTNIPQSQDLALGQMQQGHLDPLDLEVVERALQLIADVIKTDAVSTWSESSQALRCELAELVCTSGVSDPDVLLDMFVSSKDLGTRISTSSNFRARKRALT